MRSGIEFLYDGGSINGILSSICDMGRKGFYLMHGYIEGEWYTLEFTDDKEEYEKSKWINKKDYEDYINSHNW